MQNNSLILFRLFAIGGAGGSAFGCGYFGQLKGDYIYMPNGSGFATYSGLNGAALGFGILSGCCILALAITFLRKTE